MEKESPHITARRRHHQEGTVSYSGSGSASSSVSEPYLPSGPGSEDSESGTSIYQGTTEFTIALLEREEHLLYGWGKCTPAWLQWCCTPQFLLFSLTLIAFCQGFFVHGILPGSLSTIHSRFHFTMVELGLIRAMYDIGLAIGFIPVVYMDARGAKRSIWIGISCVLMSIGALTCALPHFFSDHYNDRTSEFGLHVPCSRSNPSKDIYSHTEIGTNPIKRAVESEMSSVETTEIIEYTSESTFGYSATEQSTDFETKSQGSETNTSTSQKPTVHHQTNCNSMNLNLWKFVFMLGVFLNGLGGAAYFTMGIAFLDDSVPPGKSVLYTGVLNAALLFGVGCGLLVSGLIINTVYVDFNWDVKSPEGMTKYHPYWISAWWLGIVIASSMFALSALPVFGFPRQLPGVVKAHLEELLQSDPDSKRHEKPEKDLGSMTHSTSVWKSLKVCLTNVTYLGLTLEMITTWALITAFSAFMPAYFKAVYGVPSKKLPGTIVIFALVGSVTGTFIQYRLKLSILGNLRFSLASAVAFLLFLGGIFVNCNEGGGFAGWTVTYPVHGSFQGKVQPTAACNSDCINQCSLDYVHGICYIGPHPRHLSNGKMQIAFFSPCHAGCTRETIAGGYNCSCVPKIENENYEGGGNITQENCMLPKCEYRAWAAMICFCWCAFLVFVRLNPLQQTLLRCIPFKDRVVGLMLSGLLGRVIGAIPIAPVVGQLFDMACVVHDKLCGKAGQCHWRDDALINSRIAIACYVASTLGIIGLVVAYFDQRQQLGNKPPHRVAIERTETCKTEGTEKELEASNDR